MSYSRRRKLWQGLRRTPPHTDQRDIPRPVPSPQQKLVIFTEHRDTLNYLQRRITGLVGREEAVAVIHGSMRREDRHAAQEAFRHDPHVQILLATDAAGEGINLQRAHLMVNYDLPWNPNRIEQRFGRIHRIGQNQVCYLWNLVAQETREGEVYLTLLKKLEQARTSLGGQVFDVLGKLQFEGRPLRELLVEAVRYGERPETQARLTTIVDNALDHDKLRDLLDEHSLTPEFMDAGRVHRIREDMERAEARRLQPHYIESFFLEAFQRLGGSARQREPRRYEVTHVPAPVRNRSLSTGAGRTVLRRYERIAFEKSLLASGTQTPAAFVCPGHPLLDAVIEHTLAGNSNLLRQGTVLVDDLDSGLEPRVLFFLEHSIQNASVTRAGGRQVISQRVLYVEIDAAGNALHTEYAPYLDYRPLAEDEPGFEAVLERPECAWIGSGLEQTAQQYAVSQVVPEHLGEVRKARQDLIKKTLEAVNDRLTKEIAYWDLRAEVLKAQEQAGRTNARLNSTQARRRADLLQERRERRLAELEQEGQISPLPPVVLGATLVVPVGLIRSMTGSAPQPATIQGGDTQAAAARAREIVMAVERNLGFEPTDREFEKRGYDIESRIPGTGKLRFIEVKGRVSGAANILVTRNEILYSLNKPDDFILAIVEFLGDDDHRVHYVRQPFPAGAGFRGDQRQLRLRRVAGPGRRAVIEAIRPTKRDAPYAGDARPAILSLGEYHHYYSTWYARQYIQNSQHILAPGSLIIGYPIPRREDGTSARSGIHRRLQSLLRPQVQGLASLLLARPAPVGGAPAASRATVGGRPLFHDPRGARTWRSRQGEASRTPTWKLWRLSLT